MLNGITTGVSGLRSVEWQPKLLYLQGRDVALGLAAESLQAVEHVVDVLLASFHGSFRRGHETPKLLLMTPHNDTHDSVRPPEFADHHQCGPSGLCSARHHEQPHMRPDPPAGTHPQT